MIMTANFSNIVPGYSRVSSDFIASRYNPILKKWRAHEGVDIAAKADAPVFSPPMNGVVVTIGNDTSKGGYGYYVVVMTMLPDNRGEIFTVYGDLNPIIINPKTGLPYKKGDSVAANTQIGTVAGGGSNSTGPHLHYEERIGSPNLVDTSGNLKPTANWKTNTLPVDPNQNYFGLSGSSQTQCAISQGTGICSPFLTDSTAQYTSLLDKTTGTTTLYYTSIGAALTVTLQGQEQWQQQNSDGSYTIYTRNLSSGTLGNFTPWEVQQFSNTDLLQSTGYIKSPNEVLRIISGTASTNPFLDSTGSSPANLSVAEMFALADATGGPIPSALKSTQTTEIKTGTDNTCTIYLSAACATDTQVTLTKTSGTCELCKGDNIVTFDASGNATLTIPAGQDHVTFTLVDTSNSNSADTPTLTATLTNANGSVTSNHLAVTFDSPNPNAGAAVAVNLQGTNDLVPYFTEVYKNGQLWGAQYTGTTGNDSYDPTVTISPTYIDNLNNSFNLTQGGNDVIATGTGNDTLVGGNGANTFIAGDGLNNILAGDGNNQIYANKQVDLATALGNRNGSVSGGFGMLVSVGKGNNTVVGGSGNDFFLTGGGNNVIVAGAGKDTLFGGAQLSVHSGISVNTSVASDWSSTNTNGVINPSLGVTLNAGKSNDTIYGGTGDSYYFLSDGNNWLDAGGGKDYIQSGKGSNIIYAGIGNDTIFGVGGSDFINLESGSDTVVLNGGNNTVIGGSGNNKISSGNEGTNWASSAAAANNYIYGGSGKTTIWGSGGNDTLIGGTGDAKIFGGNGNEYIVGGDGNVWMLPNLVATNDFEWRMVA